MSGWNRKKDDQHTNNDGGDSLPADGPVIRLQGVTRVIKAESDENSVALDDVSVDVGRGE